MTKNNVFYTQHYDINVQLPVKPPHPHRAGLPFPNV